MATLDQELVTYKRHLPELLWQQGKFVLIKGSEIAGIFDSYQGALTAGYQRFKLDSFLVKQITLVERFVSNRSTWNLRARDAFVERTSARNCDMTGPAHVQHRFAEIEGALIFYREAGPVDAPAVLLPHGYPCSSYEFRNLMPLLADRWRLVAPDFPGCGYSDTPDGFAYDFDGYAALLEKLVAYLGIRRFALYLHDFGSQIGLRLAIRDPDRIVALIVQNGDIYEDALGPKYAPLQEYFRDPTPERRAKLSEAVSEDGFRDEFLNEVRPELARRISPDLWKLHWSLTTPRRKQIAVELIAGLRDNLTWFPKYQAYLRRHRPPTLIVWGPQDGYMPEASARAYLRDLPNAEMHILDGGHWLLETNLSEVVSLTREFLSRVT